jgi:hypothetical protein
MFHRSSFSHFARALHDYFLEGASLDRSNTLASIFLALHDGFALRDPSLMDGVDLL